MQMKCKATGPRDFIREIKASGNHLRFKIATIIIFCWLNAALGTTIDYENDHVYWLVKKLNGASLLYRNHIDSPHSAPVINTIASSAKGNVSF